MIALVLLAATTWTHGSAFTVEKGRVEAGLVRPLRWGVAENVEVGTHVAFDLLRMPNAAVKIRHGSREEWTLATEHDLSYPTPFLRSLAHRGAYGLIAPDEAIAEIVALHSRALASREVGERGRVTISAGVRAAARFGKMEMATIDLPIVFTRTSAYHHGATFQAGLDVEGPLWRRIGWRADSALFVTRDARGRHAFEQSALLTYRGRRAALEAGALYVNGDYPFGPQTHVLPWLDLRFAF